MVNNCLLLLSSIFFNLFKRPSFLSDLFNRSVNTLPNGEYSKFACSNASGLYPKSFLVKYSYLVNIRKYSYLIYVIFKFFRDMCCIFSK